MRLPAIRSVLPCLMPLILLLFALDAHAEITSVGLMDDVLNEFKNQIIGWGDIFKHHAFWLFWMLATISLVWTFGMMALRQADIGEFFAEFVRFSIFVGFFWWLLDNGPAFARAIIDSLTQIGGEVNRKLGYAPELTPSGTVDIGFRAIALAIDKARLTSPVPSLAGFIFAFGILLLSVMIGVNMLMLLISSWILAYAGIFVLGFGGSRWTSEMAITYYKTVLGIGLQIMTMLLLIGIGSAIMEKFYKSISDNPAITEMAVVFVVAFIVYHLSSKVPPMIAGMVGGGGGGDMGIGSFAGGAAVGAAMSAVKTGVSAVASVGKGAVPAAFKTTADAAGLAKSVAALGSSLSQDGKRAGGGATAFAKAAGIRTGGAVMDGLRGIKKSFNEKKDSSFGSKAAKNIEAKDRSKSFKGS